MNKLLFEILALNVNKHSASTHNTFKLPTKRWCFTFWRTVRTSSPFDGSSANGNGELASHCNCPEGWRHESGMGEVIIWGKVNQKKRKNNK